MLSNLIRLGSLFLGEPDVKQVAVLTSTAITKHKLLLGYPGTSILQNHLDDILDSALKVNVDAIKVVTDTILSDIFDPDNNLLTDFIAKIWEKMAGDTFTDHT
jgi:hypothetical protein